MKYLDTLLQVKTEDRSLLQIICWWELRRVLYNIIVLLAGSLSIGIMLLASSSRVHLEPGEDFFEPILVLMVGFLCNIAYTLGWLTEVFLKRSLTYGPKMFKIGLYFTLFWVFLPSAIWVIIALVDLF
ncbi:MAG: hypothetical protein CFE21_15560 [Bacteroidetes bacterium B1(2017)]|nr:MAG: hypothetical protein CFE21_15560 [Bacteroidetes bacterium B1(2017)]